MMEQILCLLTLELYNLYKLNKKYMEKNLNKMSLIELKASKADIYDLMAKLQKDLQMINGAIIDLVRKSEKKEVINKK